MVRFRESLDRVIRRAMGNPISKGIVGKLVGDKVVDHYDTPVLSIERGYVDDFYYLNSIPPHYRRFIIVKVRNIGPYEATNCWGTITVEELGLKEVPLHWADESYEIRRDSMIPINIPPGISRDLDIAFSVYGSEYSGGSHPLTTTLYSSSSSTKISKSEKTPSITSYDLVRPRGTFTPEVARTDSNQQFQVTEREPEPPMEGAWLASHLVIAYPSYDSEHYLPPQSPPRRYHGEIKVICGNGTGDRCPIVIISAVEPSNLLFDWRVTPI